MRSDSVFHQFRVLNDVLNFVYASTQVLLLRDHGLRDVGQSSFDFRPVGQLPVCFSLCVNEFVQANFSGPVGALVLADQTALQVKPWDNS